MRLPPLNALKAFEAAARLGSFTRAGEELHVSPGAISRHVKLLEQHLGTPLFRRLPQGLEYTEAATALQPRVSAAFADIARAAAETSAWAAPGTNRLRILASPTFAGRWLIPRLQKFRDRIPEVTLSVAMMHISPQEFQATEHDIGVATFHAGDKAPDGLRTERVKGEELTPLCAPAILTNEAPLNRPADLARHTLIRIVACPEDWPAWLADNGCAGEIAAVDGPLYDTGELAIRAAAEGLGVVLMDRFLVERELASGELTDPLPQTTPIANGYFFFCEHSRWDEPLIRGFRDWLKTEARR
jgi:LysR family glycine cleavage system transcriptional activator